MATFEEMGYGGNFDSLPAPPFESETATEEAPVEEDYGDEEMDIDELERRMWRDRMLLRRLKEGQLKEGVDIANQRQSQEQARRIDIAKQQQSQEQARRKKMFRAQKDLSRCVDVVHLKTNIGCRGGHR